MQENTIVIEEQIREELRQLGSFYNIQTDAFESIVQQADLSHYVEIVLLEDGLELLLGGMGREQALLDWASSLQFPKAIQDSFAACTKSFPNKMVYAKTSLSKDKLTASMYLCLVEPWEAVTAFLERLPSMEKAIEALKDIKNKRSICYLLGFTLDPNTQELTLKAYHLFDRLGKPQSKLPFLISHRITASGQQKGAKYYTAALSWDELEEKTNWPVIQAKAQSLFGDNYHHLYGEYPEDLERGKKIYVMRHDVRQDANYQLKTYNFYVEEANRLIQMGDNQQAINVMTEAIHFHEGPNEFLALLHNVRGVLYFSLEQFDPAISDFNRATELAPSEAQPFHNLGEVYFHLGDNQRAVDAYQKSLSLNPEGDDHKLRLALANLTIPNAGL